VNAWLLRAPWWKVSVVAGVLLAPFIIVAFRFISDMSWTAAVITGLIATAACGPMVGYMSSKQADESTSPAGPLPEEDRVRVERAARRGPVPAEDELREAALRIVEHRLFVLQVSRGSALGTTRVLLVGTVFLAVVHSPWWWLGLVAGLALLALVLVTPSVTSSGSPAGVT
jgi:hypothetical protein